MDFGPVSNLTVYEYRRKCAELLEVKGFDATAVYGKDLAIYDRNRFEQDMALDAWKRRAAGLSRWCVGILVGTRFVNIPLVWYERKLANCRRLRDAIDAYMYVTKGDLGLQGWFSDKPYTSMYLMSGGTHRTRALEFWICQRTAVCSLILVERVYIRL